MGLDHDYLRCYTIKQNDVLVDLGATVGEFAMQYREQILKTDSFIWQVEPEMEGVGKMHDWCIKNIPNNFGILNTGIWSENTHLVFTVTDNIWCNMFEIHQQMPEDRIKKRVIYPAITLQTILEISGGTINFLKADIESAEVPVLMGFPKDKFTNIHNMAIAAYHKTKEGIETGEILKPYMESVGYKVELIREPYNGFPPYLMMYCSRD